ncbi:hypothetical protein VM1G_06285 [Cytospora mali]|uniref:Uncharacterized protein n=1 Tax=Cytospora mali TaxID=578113 RepID=A0A194W259_CYTMA|nr:hypothetical protein VM1G_06285 [Valsa mali]
MAFPEKPSQNSGNSRNGNQHPSANVPYAEARFIAAATQPKPSTARNSTPSHITNLLETMKQYPINHSPPQVASGVVPKPMVTNPQAQLPTTAIKRTNNSVRSAAEGPGTKRRKGSASKSTRVNGRIGQKSSGALPTHHESMPQGVSSAAANRNNMRTSNQGSGNQQTSAAKVPQMNDDPQLRLQPAGTNPVNATTNADSTAQHPSVKCTKQNVTEPTHFSPASASTCPQLSIESGLEKMIKLSDAIKHKTIPRTEALGMMDKVRSLVEHSIHHWHHVLSQKEDEDLTALRMVHSITPVTYD